jgi:SAM-dependent methyltransferase
MDDYRTQFTRECLSYAGTMRGRSVLVVGCGSGVDCRPFVEADAIVCGLDKSDDIGHDFQHPEVVYEVGTIEQCHLESERFDVVFCIATMEHVHGIESAFREMVRTTKPGGLIYSVAAPLWNSRQGHHIKCFDRFPWIHLRAGQSELSRIALENGISHFNGHEIRYVIDFIFSDDYFNRQPARRYLEACSGLAVSQTLRNSLWLEETDSLTPELFAEMQLKGLTRDELLAVSHSFIARR